MGTVDTKALHQEMIELEQEFEAAERPTMSATSVEDVDDDYQANLEYNWWLDEMQEKYDGLRQSLGYKPKSL